MAEEIIARDQISGTIYEYRIGPSGSEDKAFSHQIQLRSAGSDRWDTALMGNYGSREAALNTFISRYTNREGLSTLEPVHPTIQKNFDARVLHDQATARQAGKDKERREEAEKEHAARRVEIDKGFSQASFKKVSAPRAGPKGVELSPAVGPSFGGLIVHENGLTGRNKGYNITHAQSGLALGGDFQTQKEAKIAVWRLAQLANFDQPAEGLQADTKASGLSFGEVLRRLTDNAYSDLDDVQQAVKPSSRKAAELKESQEKRKKETLARNPTGEELLSTRPERLGQVFHFPTGKAMPRSRQESNRLVEAAANAAEEADKVALSNLHPSMRVVDALAQIMTPDEKRSFLNSMADKTLPFYEAIERKRLRTPPAVRDHESKPSEIPRVTHAQGVRAKAQAGALKPRTFRAGTLSASAFKSAIDKSGDPARPGDTLRGPNGDEFIITNITDKDVIQFTNSPAPGGSPKNRNQFGSFKAPIPPHLKGAKARIAADRRERFDSAPKATIRQATARIKGEDRKVFRVKSGNNSIQTESHARAVKIAAAFRAGASADQVGDVLLKGRGTDRDRLDKRIEVLNRRAKDATAKGDISKDRRKEVDLRIQLDRALTRRISFFGGTFNAMQPFARIRAENHTARERADALNESRNLGSKDLRPILPSAAEIESERNQRVVKFKAKLKAESAERLAVRMKQHAEVAARPAVKAIRGVSVARATARFEDANAGRAKGKGPRRPERDLLHTSKEVAPRVAINTREERQQKRWFKNPGKLDFQGVDTKGARKPRFKKDQRRRGSTARAGGVR